MASQNAVAALIEWVNANGGHLHPAVEVYSDPSSGLSFRVKPGCRPISPREPIVHLPSVLSLSYLNALGTRPSPSSSHRQTQAPLQSEDPPVFPPDFMAKTPPHVVGRLLLVREYLRGPESPWWPYIAALPSPNDAVAWQLPPFWGEDAELFEGTNIQPGIAKIRGEVRREFDIARDLLLDTCEKSGSGSGSESEGEGMRDFVRGLTRELYHWAFCVHSSRSFRPALVLPEREWKMPAGVGIDDFGVLLPLFDIGNHDMTAPAQWVVHDEGSLDGASPFSGACSLRVDKEFRAGEQVFNNYGLKTNAELLLGYGFMLPVTQGLHNDYVHVKKRGDETGEWLISRRAIADASSILVRAREGIKNRGGGDERGQVLGYFERVQWGMVWDIFKMMAGGEAESLIPLDGDTKGEGEEGDDETRRRRRLLEGRVEGRGRQLMEQTAAVIQNKLLQELERLDETDLEVDGDEDELSPRQRLVLEYRRRCRSVLEGYLERMETAQYTATYC